ncbi:hypothetical protein ACH4E7_44170 [Kitasatospora sp. NPDC018058]|uniref:hypothetical protein n=1 Tax=Kitasatospora sp. NPDC018058 TaxID=3364025 RepID=UPI0037C14EAE
MNAPIQQDNDGWDPERIMIAFAEALGSTPPDRSSEEQVLVLADDMARRTAARLSPGRSWTAHRQDDGTVRATAEDGTVAVGWTATPQAVTELVAPWEPGTVQQPLVDLHGATDRTAAVTKPRFPYPDTEQLDDAFDAPSRIADITEAINALRSQWSGESVADRVEEATQRLRQTARQVPELSLDDGEKTWCLSASCGWVRTEAIVNAGDRIWGKISRSGYGRGSSWIPRAAAELLAEPQENLEAFLRHHLLDNEGPVELETINGPEGPLYTLGSGGAHRTHLFRILGLPWLFARQTALIPPRQITGPIESAAHWQGLIYRGLLHGTIHRQTTIATLRIDHCPAPWMVTRPALATAYNVAYDRAYPGALARLGIPTEALAGPQAWEDWLLLPPTPWTTKPNAAAEHERTDTLLAKLRNLLPWSARRRAPETHDRA